LTIPGQLRFPGGRPKALVMSYDDGSEHDRRLVEIFNRYGIRGSFHLNSGKVGQPYHVTPQDVHVLYQGHEVSCHTVSHPDLTQLDTAAVRREIADDRRALEDWSGRPVRGLAYPFGTYDQRILELLPELGMEYARTAAATGEFTLPERFLEWQGTCHHSRLWEFGERFLELPDGELALLYVWGHSYELDGFMTADVSKNWAYMDACCRRLHGQDAVWYATTIEVVDYLNACRQLQRDDLTVANPAAVAVWIHLQGRNIELKPGTVTTLEAG